MHDFTNFKFLTEHKLISWHPEGVLDLQTASMMVDLVTFHERVLDEPFNRFADWTKLSEVRLKFAEVTNLATKRREDYGSGPRVKSAFLATDPLAFGIAFVFAVLMEGSPIKVKVFREIAGAAKWLGVPAGVLQAA